MYAGIITPDAEIVDNADKLKPAYMIFKNYELILKWNRSLRFGLAVCTLKEKFRNELVTTAQTVCVPISSIPVLQHPSLYAPVKGFIPQIFSGFLYTFRLLFIIVVSYYKPTNI